MNSLHPLSTSSFIARHLLITNITEADAQTICLDATPSGLSVPHLHHPSVFMPNGLSAATLPIYPGLGQPPNNAGLHTQWRGFTHWTQVTSSDRTSPSLSTVLKKLNPTINKLFSASCGGCKHDTAGSTAANPSHTAAEVNRWTERQTDERFHRLRSALLYERAETKHNKK